MTPSCDAPTLWNCTEEDLKEMLKVSPYGYIRDGDLKIPFWATCDDPLKVQGCQMALVKFLDGSPVAVRYKKVDFVKTYMCPKCHRDLDFIVRVLGPEGLMIHQQAHDREQLIKKLETIRDDTPDRATRESLFDLIKELK